MKPLRYVIATTFLCAFCCTAFAQGSEASATTLPTGLRIPAILKTPLSSKKSKVGDAVRLEAMVDVHDKSGAVVIPRHANLYGKVTYAVPYEKKERAAGLSFGIDGGKWKQQPVTLDASIFGVEASATDSARQRRSKEYT